MWVLMALLVAAAIAALPVMVSGMVLGIMIIGLFTVVTPVATLCVLLAAAPMRTLIATEAPPAIPSDTGQLLLVVVLAAWFLNRLLRDRRLPHLRQSVLLVPILLWIFVLGLTAFSASSISAWLPEWLKWVQISLLILFVLDYKPFIRWIVFGLVLAACTNAVVGLYQYFGGSGALHLLINERNFRAFGTFGQPNPFGAYMGITAPIAAMITVGYLITLWQVWRQNRALHVQTLFWFAFYGATFLLLAGGVFISYSRGAWLGFAAALGVSLFALPQRLWQSIALVAAGIVLLLGLWQANLLPAAITARLSTITDEIFSVTDVRGVDITTANYAIVERLAHWQAAIRMAEANPWLGVGAGNYEVVYSNFQLINWDEPLGHAHNYYLNVLAEAGILGAFSYLALWVGIAVITWRARQHPDVMMRCTVIGLLGSWAYIAVHSLTDNLYVNNLFLHIGVMLGVLAAVHSDTFLNTKLEQQ